MSMSNNPINNDTSVVSAVLPDDDTSVVSAVLPDDDTTQANNEKKTSQQEPRNTVTYVPTNSNTNANANNQNSTPTDNAPKIAHPESKQNPDSIRSIVSDKSFMADMTEVLKLFFECNKEQRQSAREFRDADRQSMVSSGKKSIEHMKNAAIGSLVGGIVQGTIQAGGGAVALKGSLNTSKPVKTNVDAPDAPKLNSNTVNGNAGQPGGVTNGTSKSKVSDGTDVVDDVIVAKEIKASKNDAGVDFTDTTTNTDVNTNNVVKPKSSEPSSSSSNTADSGSQTNPVETRAPETKATQTNAPETKAPQTNAPEANAPQSNAPEANAPQTNAPEANAPQTNAPETKSEGGKTADTKGDDGPSAEQLERENTAYMYKMNSYGTLSQSFGGLASSGSQYYAKLEEGEQQADEIEKGLYQSKSTDQSDNHKNAREMMQQALQILKEGYKSQNDVNNNIIRNV